MENKLLIEEGEEVTRVVAKGAFKTSDAEIFGHKLMDVVLNNNKVLIDMAETEYICSGILRELLACQAHVDEDDNKEMVIVNVNDEIMEVFEMTGFLNILTIE